MVASRTRTVQVQTFVARKPSEAFRWVTEPKRLQSWFVDTATITPSKGGSYAFGWDGGPTHTGRVTAFVQGRSLTLTWQWPGMEDKLLTHLKISVLPAKAGSIVRFTHTGFPKQERWTELYGGAIQGWTYFLRNLKSMAEHGTDLRSPLDW